MDTAMKDDEPRRGGNIVRPRSGSRPNSKPSYRDEPPRQPKPRQPRIPGQTRYSTKMIEAMKPLELAINNTTHILSHVQVFAEQRNLVLVLSGNRGTVTAPLSRRTASLLIFQLSQRLAELPRVEE